MVWSLSSKVVFKFWSKIVSETLALTRTEVRTHLSKTGSGMLLPSDDFRRLPPFIKGRIHLSSQRSSDSEENELQLEKCKINKLLITEYDKGYIGNQFRVPFKKNYKYRIPLFIDSQKNNFSISRPA